MSFDGICAAGVLACGAYLTWTSSALTKRAVHDAQELRLKVLTDPRMAIAGQCARHPQASDAPFACDLNLAWRETNTWQDVCTSPRRNDDAQTRPARYWRISSQCAWQFAGARPVLELPLLAAQVFR